MRRCSTLETALTKLVPPAGPRFRELTRAVADCGMDAAERRFAFAELNAFLAHAVFSSSSYVGAARDG